MASTTEGVDDPNRSQRWDPKADQWEEGVRQLFRYVEHHGHARIPGSDTVDGYKLGVWVNTQLFSEPEPPILWYASTTNFAVTLPSIPTDQGEQRRTVTDAYSQVAGMHE
jgi:hypothetical protein